MARSTISVKTAEFHSRADTLEKLLDLAQQVSERISQLRTRMQYFAFLYAGMLAGLSSVFLLSSPEKLIMSLDDNGYQKLVLFASFVVSIFVFTNMFIAYRSLKEELTNERRVLKHVLIIIYEYREVAEQGLGPVERAVLAMRLSRLDLRAGDDDLKLARMSAESFEIPDWGAAHRNAS